MPPDSQKEKNAPVDESIALRTRWLQEGPDGRLLVESTLDRLRTHKSGSGPPTDTDLRGIRLLEADLSQLDLSGCDFSGADMSRCNLSGTRLIRARLDDAVLHEACLDDADLTASSMKACILEHCHATNAGFGHADLTGARMFEGHFAGCTFTGATLDAADLRASHLASCSFQQARLHGTDLSRSHLVEADMLEADLTEASLAEADLRRAKLQNITGYAQATWIGTDLREVDYCGASLLKRHAMDENYLHEFRQKGRANEWIYFFWWLTSDCGRSMGRWAAWIVVLILFFGGVYSQAEVDYGNYETWLSPIYYSVVTLTSLGYGDVLPASTFAQIAAMTQVLIGYLMLGGLLSILSNKMARRS